MQFSSAVFLILFLPAVMILYFCGFKNRVYKNTVLLLSSIGFYAWGEPLFVFVILASIFVNFMFGKYIAKTTIKKRQNFLLVFSIIFNFGILFITKYLTFVSGMFNGLFNTPIIKITLPIGISFYTFQIMSYIFDLYFGRSHPQNNIFNLALYVLMFPQLIAGPIVRYNSIAWEIQNRKESFQDFQQGISRFVIGLAKKVLLADFLAGIADKIFITAEYTNIVTFTAWLGAIAYTS